MLHNVCDIPAISLTGVNGTSQITQAGDLNFWAKGRDGAYHNTVLSPVLLAPDSPANLVSVDQVSAAGGKCQFGKKATDNFVSFETPNGETQLVIEKVNGIHAFVCDMPEDVSEDGSSDADENESPFELAWMGGTDSLSME
jgi:hypothetical protein